MKRTVTTLIPVLVISLAVPAYAGAPRILNADVDAHEIDKVALEAGVGDIQVVAVDGTTRVVIEVKLKPRRGGFFSSMRKAEREVEEAELSAEIRGSTLRLEIDTGSDDRHFEETWTIELPPRLDFDLELGVGDVDIRDVHGELTAEIGVGDVLATGTQGDVSLEVGVGDAEVQATADHYGSVAGSGGVGDAKLTGRGERVSSSGFVGHSAEWSGDGEHHIEISVGVGDARVTLE